MRRFPFISLAGTMFALALLWDEDAAIFCQFDRAAILHGQIWRLFTCHFAHWSLSHAIWSTSVFAGLGAVCETRKRWLTALSIFVSPAAISLAILVVMPSLEFYRGLSGLDSALYGLLVVFLLREVRSTSLRLGFGVVAVGGFIAKIFYEAHTHKAMFADSTNGFVPLPLAHGVGLAAGLIVGMWESTK